MIFMYIVTGTAVMLLVSVAIAILKQREIKVNVISREPMANKEFFALRIESDDFLFVRDEEAVTFIQRLDDVSDYQMVDLTKKPEGEDKLVMPTEEKKAS